MPKAYLKIAIGLIIAVFGLNYKVQAAATLLPQPEQCFSGTTGIAGMVGTLGPITGGTGGTAGTYTIVPLTGGSGTGATANITVAGGAVTAVVIVNPGTAYASGDTLSAAAVNIGGVAGFSVPVLSIAVNSALAGGRIFTYIPATTTFKTTWFNADQSVAHQNTNPITLDSNGCAIIYGTGSYRFIVQDSLGNTVYDQVTTDTSASNSVFWAGVASGTNNTIAVSDPGFNGTSGSIINFVALLTNTGAATLNPSGFGAVNITKPSSSGPVSLVSGDIVATNEYNVIYNSTLNTFQLLSQPAGAGSTISAIAPGGYLTLSSDANEPVMNADVTSATTVFYTPYQTNQIPIWNGSSFANTVFPQLSLVLNSSFSSGGIFDVCVFLHNGIPVLIGAPAWSTTTPGAGARGASAAIQKLQGIWVNSVQITDPTNTYTVPSEQCTIVGTIVTDGAGTISAKLSYGQTRAIGLWNFYNRQKLVLREGDPAAGWTGSGVMSPTFRSSNNSALNKITVLTGLAEEPTVCIFQDSTKNSAGVTNQYIGIGWNITSTPSGTIGQEGTPNALVFSINSYYANAPALGLQVASPLESWENTGTSTFLGTQTYMIFQCDYRG